MKAVVGEEALSSEDLVHLTLLNHDSRSRMNPSSKKTQLTSFPSLLETVISGIPGQIREEICDSGSL